MENSGRVIVRERKTKKRKKDNKSSQIGHRVLSYPKEKLF